MLGAFRRYLEIILRTRGRKRVEVWRYVNKNITKNVFVDVNPNIRIHYVARDYELFNVNFTARYLYCVRRIFQTRVCFVDFKVRLCGIGHHFVERISVDFHSDFIVCDLAVVQQNLRRKRSRTVSVFEEYLFPIRETYFVIHAEEIDVIFFIQINDFIVAARDTRNRIFAVKSHKSNCFIRIQFFHTELSFEFLRHFAGNNNLAFFGKSAVFYGNFVAFFDCFRRIFDFYTRKTRKPAVRETSRSHFRIEEINALVVSFVRFSEYRIRVQICINGIFPKRFVFGNRRESLERRKREKRHYHGKRENKYLLEYVTDRIRLFAARVIMLENRL